MQLNADVLATKQCHDLLQRVAVFTDDADSVSLNARLGLLLRVLNGGHNDLCLLGRDPLHELDLLANAGVSRRFDLFELEVFERNAALDQLLREDLDDGLELVIVLAR